MQIFTDPQGNVMIKEEFCWKDDSENLRLNNNVDSFRDEFEKVSNYNNRKLEKEERSLNKNEFLLAF